MSKKHVEIEIFDKKTELITTGGGVVLTQNANVPNWSFNNALDTTNLGKTGCSASEDFIEYNYGQANGDPVTTNLKPCSFNTTASAPALSTGGSCINFRNTELPYTSANKLVFPSTPGGGVAGTNLVLNGYFGDNLNIGGVSYTGFVHNSYYASASSNHDAARPWTAAMNNGHIATTPSAGSIANNAYWYGASTLCDDRPQANDGSRKITKPDINYQIAGGFCTLNTNAGTLAYTNCAAASSGFTGIYQVIQGLTPGTTYDLKVKFRKVPNGDWGFGLGNDDLNGGWVSTAGDTYINLGGTGTNPMYQGTVASGSSTNGTGLYANNTHPNIYPISPTTLQEQTTSFVAQGGNEVLTLRYESYDVTGTSAIGYVGDYLEIEHITITEQAPAPMNASTVYGLVDVWDSNAGAPATSGKLKFQMVGGNAADIAIVVTAHGNPITNLTGLEPLTNNQLIISNNTSSGYFTPTHSLVAGVNEIPITINGSSSSGAFGAYERLFEFTVLNPLGVDPSTGLNPMFSYADVEFEYTTVASSYNQIDEAKSVVGKLEVSDSEDFPLNISYAVSDGKDLDSRFGDYSQTFDLPATANNNRVLNHIWKANVDQSDKKLFGVKDCKVKIDGVPFFDGMIQVKASEHKGVPESYSCTLYGGNFSWMSTLKDKKLCEVFPESDDFQFDFFNIANTWAQLIDTTHIQYPLISRKDFYPGGPQNVVNNQDDSKFPDLQPVFYVKTMLTKIFENIGYTIDSTFLDTEHVSRLVTMFPFQKNDTLDEATKYSCHVRRKHLEYGIAVEFDRLTDLQTTGPDGDGWHTMKMNESIADPSGSYEKTTGIWTCQKEGLYHINIANGAASIFLRSHKDCNEDSLSYCDWYWDSFIQDSWQWHYRIRVIEDPFGTPTTSYVQTTSTGWSVVAAQPLSLGITAFSCGDYANNSLGNTIPTGSVTLAVGDTIEIQLKVDGFHWEATPTTCGAPDVLLSYGWDSLLPGSAAPEFKISFDTTSPLIGDTIEFNSILPCDTSQVDFIKAISHLFNLYFTTDVQSKKVYIEPFNEFFKPSSEGVSWDRKVDYSKPIVDDYDIGLKRELHVKYKTDSQDVFATALNYKDNIWGEDNRLYNYKEILGEDYESGKVELENNLFASSTQVWDNDAHENISMDKAPVLIPNLWNEDCESGVGVANTQFRPSTVIEGFVPRIFYYAMESVSSTTLPNGPVNPGGEQTYWTWGSPSGIYNNVQAYPRATFVDWDESFHGLTLRPSLSFADETFIALGQSWENHVPGLYTVYYKNMIEQLKKAPRIRKVWVNLKVSDILNLDMRQLIHLDECWWRINRIVGFSPSNNQSTQIELIQWLDVGYWPVIDDYENLIKYE